MAEKKNPLGPTGAAVAANVKRIREAQNLTYAELSRRLDEAGRKIPVLGLSRIEDEARRVDTDDLMALAVALGVTPTLLMMPVAPTDETPVQATGHPEPLPAEQLFRWLTAYSLIDRKAIDPRMLQALPGWVAIDIESGYGPWSVRYTREEMQQLTHKAAVDQLKSMMLEGWRRPASEKAPTDGD